VSADEFFEPKTTIGGYGEMHYDMEANDGDGKLDFHRFIVYYKHQFSPEWSMMSEVEIEHNMVGSESSLGYKGGYLAMEQAHLNYWNGSFGFKGGVILVPAGIINEYHEPPTFMSVERPEYNKYIIPTTWFDNGFSLYGTKGDFNWNVTLTGDLDGDAIGAGIRGARLKGYYSKASSWTKTIQGSFTGVDGLKLGGSVTMNDAPKDDGTSVGVTLTEFNGTYYKNNMYARMEYGMIDYTDNPVTDTSNGYYLDLGYNVAELVGCDGDMFVWTRTSNYTRDDVESIDISLFGLTYKPLENVSFKFELGSKNDADVMRFGLGYMF
tara:strand:- start:1640 stop:2608 length:969 start_codon:yes stop_codon:yes gene_type:complete